jgi:hypothetical protein
MEITLNGNEVEITNTISLVDFINQKKQELESIEMEIASAKQRQVVILNELESLVN